MKIVIVGGGTAGWLITCYLSIFKKQNQYVCVTSKEVPIIGVGEGTTGKFVDIFREEINPHELMIGCEGLPKLGILFKNWGQQNFFSPIEGSLTSHESIDSCLYYSLLYDLDPLETSISGILTKNNLVNFSSDGRKLTSGLLQNALHIDAYKTSEFFRGKAIQNGVTHIESTVKKVNLEHNKIRSIVLSDNQEIEGDLFIDCSGFSRVLSSNFSDTGWVDYSEYLPVNSAITFWTEVEEERKPYTLAHAMNHGWVWEIPTRNKIGKGYVFCDKYADGDSILDELKKHYSCDVEKLKEIKFKTGRVNKFLNSNCLSLGLSSAFLEPLQATSLHTTILQLVRFSQSFLSNSSLIYDEDLVNQYNEDCGKIYDDMKDFVSLHYSGNKSNTEFWKSIVLTDKVKQIIHTSKKRLTRSFDFSLYDGCAAQGLWNQTLSGLGHFSKETIREVFLAQQLDSKKYLRGFNQQKEKVKFLSSRNLSPEQLNSILKNK